MTLSGPNPFYVVLCNLLFLWRLVIYNIYVVIQSKGKHLRQSRITYYPNLICLGNFNFWSIVYIFFAQVVWCACCRFAVSFRVRLISHKLLQNSYNKPVFSLLRWLSTWRCPHFLLSAFACYRSLSLARGALSSKPATRSCCCRSMGQIDGRIDGRSTVS